MRFSGSVVAFSSVKSEVFSATLSFSGIYLLNLAVDIETFDLPIDKSIKRKSTLRSIVGPKFRGVIDKAEPN
jgi:hypothetical protein